MNLQITITGEPGCGKTTVAKLLAEELGLNYVSTGAIQREIADKRGLTTLELNRRAEDDKSIDDQIDAHTRKLAQSRQDVVVDSRLAWHFLPESLKIFLVCPTEVAAKRVFAEGRNKEQYPSKDLAIASLTQRYESEIARFRKYYGATLSNLRNFDLVIDTTVASPEVIAKEICAFIRSKTVHPELPRILISPTSLFPTQAITEISLPKLTLVRNHFGLDLLRFGDIGCLRVLRLENVWAIYDGHKRTALAVDLNRSFLHSTLVGQDDEVITMGLTVRSFVHRELTWSRIYDWEAAFEMKMVAYPAFLPPQNG